MSKISLEPNASGAGTFTLAAPNSNTNRTLNLPDESGILFSDGSGVPGSAVTGQLASSNMPAGSVIQVVSETLIGAVSTSSGSFVDTGLSASITPTSPSSKILVTLFHTGLRIIPNEARLQIELNENNVKVTSLEKNAGFRNGDGNMAGTGITVLRSLGSTSQVTYKTVFRNNGSSGNVIINDVGNANDNDGTSSITLMEIAG